VGRKIATLHRRGEKKVEMRFVEQNFEFAHLAKIFWRTSSKKRFGGFNWLISGEKEEQKNVNNEHKR
jgi:hypothetical protein